MNGKKVLSVVAELGLLALIVMIGIRVFQGSPEVSTYSNEVMMPLMFIYIGFYALKTFVNRSANSLKYLFYAAFGILVLGIRFYANLELISSIKYIALACVATLIVYHSVELIKLFKKEEL